MQNYNTLISELINLINQSSNTNKNLQYNTEKFYPISYKSTCDFTDINQLQFGLWSASSFMTNLKDKICEILNMSNINIYRNDNPKSLAASAIENGHKFITYNKNRFVEYHKISKWVSVAIIGHEVGHQYAEHKGYIKGNKEYNWRMELQADYISGYIMSMVNASYQDTIEIWRDVLYSLSPFDVDTHPRAERRMKVMLKGWEKGSNNGYTTNLRFL